MKIVTLGKKTIRNVFSSTVGYQGILQFELKYVKHIGQPIF